MNHLFVPYELAVKLKEKGFDEPCFGLFDNEELEYNGEERIFPFKNFMPFVDTSLVAAPLYQQVVDWLREKYRINTYANSLSLTGYYGFVGEIGNYSNAKKIIDETKVLTYYESLTKAIEEALNLIN